MPRRATVHTNVDGTTSSKDNVVWTTDMDNILIDAMLDEERKGNRPNGNWSTHAYNNMLLVLTTTFGKHIKKENIKNRMKTLKKTFGECKDLFYGLSGFAWNPTTKMFDAEMDVWQQLIQEKPQARKWMHTSVDNYDKLLELFGEQRATGQYAESAREKVARWQMEGCSSQFDLNDSMESYMMSDSEGIMGNDFSNAENVNSPEYAPSINSQGTSSSRGRKRKASMMEMLAKQYEKLNTNIERVSEVLDRGNVIAENGNMIAEKSLSIIESGRPQFYKPEEIYAEVELIGSEMGEDFVINAYNYLSNNASATRSFFGLPRDKRFGWLFRLVGTI